MTSAGKPARKQPVATLNPYRLLLEPSGYGGGIRGSIQRGSESVYGWTAHALPADLTRFLASHYFYESTRRYFEMFQHVTGGIYPIFFRDSHGTETQLTYEGERSCVAGIVFTLRDTTIEISRTFADGNPLPEQAIFHGQMLFDIEAGHIIPVTDPAAWNSWESIFDTLERESGKNVDDEWGDESWEVDEWDDEWGDELSDEAPQENGDFFGLELWSHRHTLSVSQQLFNTADIRFMPGTFEQHPPTHYFLTPAGEPDDLVPLRQSYLVDIPHGLNDTVTVLEPVSVYDHEVVHLSAHPFWLLDPQRRAHLSAQMRTKKRLRAVLDAAFALLDEPRTTGRNAIIRSVTSSPDFLKRTIKREAKQLLTQLPDLWHQSSIVAQGTPDGWRFLRDEYREQARLLKILYDTFGLEAFVGGAHPLRLEVATDKLLKELPQLTTRLQLHAFSLRIGHEPLAMASWEFSLDATRSTLDWFELRPEIRCNGEILTEEELRSLMDGSGILRRGGKLMLLDDVNVQVLAMFAGAISSHGKRKKKGEKELVRVPRLQILDWLQLRNHGVQVILSEGDAQILENLLNFSSIKGRPVPGILTATLRHYQIDAWHWLAFMYEHRFGACLADDMGLGKTVQGITLLAGILSGELTSTAVPGAPHLVVAPPSLLFNWESELARFLPTARVMIYSGTSRSTSDFEHHDIVITSYGIVQRDSDILAGQNFNVLIFDETQVVKNLQAATSNAVRKLRGAFTLALTGTPVENHLGEYFAIMDLCLPGLLGSREEFNRTINREGATGTARLIGRTRPFVLRRTKQLIADELPPKIEIDIPLELTTKQRTFYQRTVEEVKGQVQAAYASHAPAQARIIALTAILRLRQICLAPALASPGASDGSPKLEFLAEQLAELRDEGHSSLVFSQFTSYLDLIEGGLKQLGFSCLRLDGSTPVVQRKKLVQAFQDSTEPMVFLISLKAGGKGLNLTRATYVYHMDPWWNPAVENQASDRAHRIGQTEQVTITRLIMRHTIEEKMMALKARKLQIYKAILDDGAGGGGAGLTREDFEFLLG